MSDIKKLIELILSNEKLKNSKSFQSSVYRDEPIIQPASHMKSYIPEKIREMKKIASEQGAYYRTDEYIFYKQAKFMEDYEDDYEYSGDFSCYFPTYQKMRSDQLRGYFTWRSKIRRGEEVSAPRSFYHVYIYELLHMIGSENAEEGYHKLRDFTRQYGKTDRYIGMYSSTWLIGFVVYYSLDRSLLEGLIDMKNHSAMSVLKDCEEHDDGELFDAICEISSYNIRNSKLYKSRSDDVEEVVCSTFRHMSEYYAKHNTKCLYQKLIGRKDTVNWSLFSSAVFYDHRKHADHTYEVSDFYRFFCKKGKWYREKYSFCGKDKWLGDVLRSVDSIMRQRLDFGSPTNNPCETKWILSIIDSEIDALIESKKKKALAKIEIDVSKLEGIRRSADVIRDRLMTEEEMEEQPEPQQAQILTPAPGSIGNPFKNDTPLSDEEYAFLHSLLYGDSFCGKTMTSVLEDNINEKLFYLFQDVVIEEILDKPEVVSDYAEELKGMIPQ